MVSRLRASAEPAARKAAPDRRQDRPGDRTVSDIFAAILVLGRENQGVLRSEIAKETNLSAATVTNVVRSLLERGLVEEVPEPTRLGRPARLLYVKRQGCYAVGVRITPDEAQGRGGELYGVVTDLGAEIVDRDSEKFEGSDPDVLVDAVARVTRRLIDRRPADEKLLGLGVEVGGHIDRDGVVRWSPNLGWQDRRGGIPLAELLHRRTGLDVVVENDINALAIHEQWIGEGRQKGGFVLIWVGWGIGAGLVLNGELYHGASGGAGEFGHLPIEAGRDDDGAAACRCGARGCLETVGSLTAILRRVRKDRPDITQISHVIQAYEAGDALVRRVLDEAADGLGRAIATVVNLLNPGQIILSGREEAVVPSGRPGTGRGGRGEPEPAFVLFSDDFMDRMRGALATHAFPTLLEDCSGDDIVVKVHGPADSAQGAASAVLRRFVVNPAAQTG